MNSLSSKISIIFLISILITSISCQKNKLKIYENYRTKFTGSYFCIGNYYEWDPWHNIYYTDTITLVVTIDSSTHNGIYVDNSEQIDLIQIDTSGYFSASGFLNYYHEYLIEFFTADSVHYYPIAGGLGGGWWGNYYGSKQN